MLATMRVVFCRTSSIDEDEEKAAGGEGGRRTKFAASAGHHTLSYSKASLSSRPMETRLRSDCLSPGREGEKLMCPFCKTAVGAVTMLKYVSSDQSRSGREHCIYTTHT